MNPVESKLDDEETAEVFETASWGLDLLVKAGAALQGGLGNISPEDLQVLSNVQDPQDDSDVVVCAIRNYIDLFRDGAVQPGVDLESLAYRLGYLYGFALKGLLGWEFVHLVSDAMKEGDVAVVSEDRSLVAYPAMFLFRLLSDPALENTVGLSVNMLAARPPAENPGAYAVVLS